MGALSTGALPQRLSSTLAGLQLSEFLPLCRCPVAWEIIGSYLQCWHKDRLELYCFGGSPKNDKAGKKHGLHIQGLGGKVTGLARKVLGMKDWRWSTRTVGSAEF